MRTIIASVLFFAAIGAFAQAQDTTAKAAFLSYQDKLIKRTQGPEKSLTALCDQAYPTETDDNRAAILACRVTRLFLHDLSANRSVVTGYPPMTDPRCVLNNDEKNALTDAQTQFRKKQGY
jgi:hypothetical protein